MSKKVSTKQTLELADALRKRGLYPELEHWDGHKHVDMFIPKARIYIEIDGAQHDVKAKQVVADFNRDYFSHKEGFFTKHITNEEIKEHLELIADAIVFVVKEGMNHIGENLHKEKAQKHLTITKKIDTIWFEAIRKGKKKFELRLADFEVEEGDVLRLEEWVGEGSDRKPTGRVIEKKISYLQKIDLKDWIEKQPELLDKGMYVLQFE